MLFILHWHQHKFDHDRCCGWFPPLCTQLSICALKPARLLRFLTDTSMQLTPLVLEGAGVDLVVKRIVDSLGVVWTDCRHSHLGQRLWVPWCLAMVFYQSSFLQKHQIPILQHGWWLSNSAHHWHGFQAIMSAFLLDDLYLYPSSSCIDTLFSLFDLSTVCIVTYILHPSMCTRRLMLLLGTNCKISIFLF